MDRAREIVDEYLQNAEILKQLEGRTFYAVGGTWRAFAKLHMENQDYPLHMMQGYALPRTHTFWFDPSHLRPIPPELFRYYLEVEGFTDVSIRTFEPSAERLSEDVPEGPIRENVKLLNRTLFGDRDYAVVGFAPTT